MAVGLGGEQLWLSPTVANNVNPFDDQSGQGNNGTNNGSTVVSDSSSGGSYAYDFDGTNDYIDFGSVLTGTGDFTVSAWFSTDSTSYSYIYGKGLEASAADGIGIAQQGSFYGAIGDGSGRTVLANSGSVSVSTWYHYSVTFDRDGLATKYVNGVSIGTDDISARAGDIGSDTDYIGRFGSQSGGFFDGKIDDVRAYNRLLTQAEITHLATSRGVLGPPGGATHYNPFKSHTFTNDFQQRLR